MALWPIKSRRNLPFGQPSIEVHTVGTSRFLAEVKLYCSELVMVNLIFTRNSPRRARRRSTSKGRSPEVKGRMRLRDPKGIFPHRLSSMPKWTARKNPGALS